MNIQERLHLLEKSLHAREQALIQKVLGMNLDIATQHTRLAELKDTDRWTATDYTGAQGPLALSFSDIYSIHADVAQTLACGQTCSASQQVALALAGLMAPN